LSKLLGKRKREAVIDQDLSDYSENGSDKQDGDVVDIMQQAR
jgi:hypothetical protein